MTQATVNVGNNAVKNLNPNAQQFSSSDFNNGTVLAGSTAPSDDSYADYIDNGTGSYLQQHQSHIYPVDPSSIDTLQQQQQQQQSSESNFTAHERAAMLDTIDHQQASLITPNHLHHSQSHIHQTMPDDEQAHQQIQLTPDQLRQNLKKQLEYYFSRENMVHDRYLKSQMDTEDYVQISIIANFKLVKRLTNDIQLIIDVLKELPSVEVDPEDKKVRSTDDKKYPPIRKRCIIILRDVPLDATENEVSDLFLNEHCPVPAVACERALESGTSDCWYITFNSEDDAQNAFLYLTRENVSIRGHKVLARMKARLWQKPSSSGPSTNPTTPVSPPMTSNNSGATSPPTLPTSQQQQQPIQTYQNSTFVPQQQQQAPPPPPQYSSHPQQQQFNQQQIPPQQQHAPVYMQTTANTHPNQTSILGNLQAQTNNYRHPMHSSVAPPPPQHVAAQFSTTNQTQHPTSIEHAQVLQQHLRMSYPNYSGNTPFDRATWATHPQNVQQTQQTLSFAATPQQVNMASYPGSLHHQQQYITANYPGFPGNLWYMSSTYPTAEQYPTMAYNGANKPKNRMTRDYPLTSKSRNSTKPPGARNSRHEGLQMNNEHSNELLDYCQHSTPHSEGSSSPVPRAEAIINRTNEPIVQPILNTSLQHVQSYPTNPIDTSSNDNVDHYHHHQSTNDVLYNNTNSHLQQQGSSDTNSSQDQTNDLGKFSNQSTYSNSTSIENSKLNYQPLEQRKPPSINQDQQQQHNPSINENQQQQQSNKKANSQQTSIRPLMSRENRSTQNSTRPSSSSSSQQGRSQQQQQQTRMNSNSSTPLTVTIPKVSSATYYNQTSSSSPQSPNSNQKTQQQQQQQQQQQANDNNGPRTYADMLKVKQAPQQQQLESTKSPTNETNDLLSPRAQSPINNNTNPKTDSISVNAETNGPLSSSSSDLSPSNQTEPAIPSQTSTINDPNPARRNSSASDHPQQQHSSSPSHQQYSNSRGRGGGRGGGGGGAYRYSNNERRSGSSNSLNRGGGGRGGGRRPVNNNAGSNGPSGYQSRGSGGRGNGRFFDRSRGGGGNYHNSNQTVHRFTGNTGNVEPQVHYAD